MSDEDDAAVEDEVHPATSLPLTKEVRGVKKRFYRTRAHSNPLNDGHYPILPLCPEAMDWSHQFCGYTADFAHREWFVDVGSGYGGLLAAMAPLYPDAWLVGLEIRERVMEFCEAKLAKLRSEGNGQYDNVTYIRTNAMRFMPNFFKKSQISKMFFCYSDPHFKKKKWRQRIISHQLLAEYAYVLKPGAIVYTVTDVKDLHLWTKERFESHPLFEAVSSEEAATDPITSLVRDRTDEATKVEREGGEKYSASFRRKHNPEEPVEYKE